MSEDKSPIQDSFWMRCLYELYEQAQAEGKPQVEFSDVDALVIERSKIPMKDFLERLRVE